MSNQLAININVQGAAAAQAALQSVAQSAQQAAAAINSLGSGMGGTTAAVNTATNAIQQHAASVNNATTVWTSFGGAISGLPGPLGNMGHIFASVSVEIDRTALALTAFGGAATASIGSLVHEAANYESAMAQVKVVTNATGEQMDALSKSAMDLGARTAFDSTSVMKGFYELASAGLTVNESLAAIEPLTKAAMLAQKDLGAETKDVVNVMRQWGLEATDISHIADVQAIAVQGSTLHWNEIGDAYKNIAGRAHTMGVSLEETTAALMLTVNAGLSASTASTAVGTFLDRLAKDSGETAKGAAELGLQLYNTQGQFVGLTSVLTQIEGKLPGMTQQQINHAESLLSGARASGFLRNALGQQQTVQIDGNDVTLKGTALMKYWTDQLTHASGVVDQQAKVVFATFNMQLKNLAGSIGELQIQLGKQFLPVLEALAPIVMGVVNALVQAPPLFHETAAAVIGAEAALLTIGGTAMIASAGLSAMGLSLVAILGPIAAIALVVGGLTIAWQTDFLSMRTETLRFVADVTPVITHLGEVIGGFVQGVVSTASDFAAFWMGLSSDARAAIPTTTEVVNQLIRFFHDDLVPAVNAFVTEWQARWLDFRSALTEAYNAALPMFNAVGAAIKTLQATASTLGDAFTQAWSIVSEQVSTAWATVEPIVTQIQDWLGTALPAAVTAAQADWTAFWDAVPSTVGAAWATISPILDGIGGWLDAHLPPAIALAQSTWEGFWNEVGPTAELAWAVIGPVLGQLKDWMGAQLPGAAEVLKTVVGGAFTYIKDVIGNILGNLQTVFGPFFSLLGTLGHDINAALQEGLRNLSGAADLPLEQLRTRFAKEMKLTDTEASAAATALGEDTMRGIVQGMATASPEVMAAIRVNVRAMIQAAVDEADAHSPSRATSAQVGVPLAQGIAEGFDHEMLKTQAKAREDMKRLVASLKDSVDPNEVAQALFASSLSSTITTALSKSTIEVKANVQALLNQGDTFNATRAAAAAAGVSFETFTAAVNGNARAQAQLQQGLKNVQEQMLKYGEVTNQAARAGIEMSAGAAAGITNGAAGMRAAMADAARGAVEAGRQAVQAQSPSQLTANQIGLPMAQGIGVGFTQGLPSLISTVQGGLSQLVADTSTEIAQTTATAATVAGQAALSQAGAYLNSLVMNNTTEMVTKLSAVPAGSPVSLAFPTGGNPWSPGATAGQLGPDGLEPSQLANAARVTETLQQRTDRINKAYADDILHHSLEHLSPADPIGFAQRILGKELTEWDKIQRQDLQTRMNVDDATFAKLVPLGATLLDRSTWGPASQQTPQGIYGQLYQQRAGSLLTTALSGLPLNIQAQYQSMLVQTGDAAGTLRAFVSTYGGNLTGLEQNLNQTGWSQATALNPQLGPSANAVLAQGAGGAGGGAGGGNAGTSGSGFAQAPLQYAAGFGMVDKGVLVRVNDTAQEAAQSTAAMAQEAKDLAGNVSLAAMAWSSISDISNQARTSIAAIPGAFSAITGDLNAASKSSITGSWTLPTLGGPSGPMAGPGANPAGIPSGSTYGGQSFGALEALAASVVAAHPDVGPDQQARLIQQAMRTNQDYIKAVGPLTDTTDDLRRQQEDAQNQVFNLTSAAASLGGAYAAGTGISQQLADAQAHLLDVTNAVAAATIAPVAPVAPTPQAPTTPVPTPSQIANLGPGQFYTLNSAGELVISTAQNLSAGTNASVGSTPAQPSTSVSAPVSTPTPTTTTTTSTSTTKPTGPVKIGTTATGLDVYQMPDGSIVRVPAGSPAPGSVPSPVTTPVAMPAAALDTGRLLQGASSALTQGLPAYVPGGPDVSVAQGSLGGPLIAPRAAGSVNIGTINITSNSPRSPQEAAVLVRQIREEFRRQGTDVMRIGGI